MQDTSQIVKVPEEQNTVANRPLGVYYALEQFYEQDLEAHRLMNQGSVPNFTQSSSSCKIENYKFLEDSDKPCSSILVQDTTITNKCKPMEDENIIKAGEEDSSNTDENLKTGKKDSRLAKIFRRKNLTNILHRFIF